MIHDITGRRLGALMAGRCCNCGFDRWQPGPRGGASQNWECATCGKRFNLTIRGASLLFAQSIGERPMMVDDWDRYRLLWPLQRLFDPLPLQHDAHVIEYYRHRIRNSDDSPAVKGAMEHFWRRLDEIEGRHG